jgi:hypothetical protein
MMIVPTTTTAINIANLITGGFCGFDSLLIMRPLLLLGDLLALIFVSDAYLLKS